jgi:metal-responsive CopG/Arc/MetJ family transcriptional regulator
MTSVPVGSWLSSNTKSIEKCFTKGIIIGMKTAISVPDDLFEAVSQAAEEENISKSKIFTEGARKYLEERNNRKLLSALNKAYSIEETEEERALRKRSKKYYARKIARAKW